MLDGVAADRNLLFGILALQMDFIRRDDLIAAMNAWVLDKTRCLGRILLQQGTLDEDAYDLLDALVRKHLQRHDDDAAKSLASLRSLDALSRDLGRVADADIHASLAHVSATRSERPSDDFPTCAPAADTRSSSSARFRILRPHARGGVGEVFIAHDEDLDREVALKEIQSRHADEPDSRARFLLEAAITGGLEHPGIVPVYALGQYADGRPYYAMRFIKGDSLQEAIARFHRADAPGGASGECALTLRQLLGRFVDVCDAVAYAHSRGVLHRDLKPGNIMLGPYGETLVVDWGLAKPFGRQANNGQQRFAEPPLQPAAATPVKPTRMGSALGTPAFMSPEQAAGRLDRIGPASDVYSLGATLYCLLTGTTPFEGADLGELLRRVQRGELRPPRQVKRTVPAALEAVCLKAMALNPEDRYSSPRTMAEDIEHWLADEPVSAWREPRRMRARRWLDRHRTLIAAGVAALLVTALAWALSATLLQAAHSREAGLKDANQVGKHLNS
jgi:serine/threonine-protein kinase